MAVRRYGTHSVIIGTCEWEHGTDSLQGTIEEPKSIRWVPFACEHVVKVKGTVQAPGILNVSNSTRAPSIQPRGSLAKMFLGPIKCILLVPLFALERTNKPKAHVGCPDPYLDTLAMWAFLGKQRGRECKDPPSPGLAVLVEEDGPGRGGALVNGQHVGRRHGDFPDTAETAENAEKARAAGETEPGEGKAPAHTKENRRDQS